MDKKVLELAREAGLNGHIPTIERFYELAVAQERKKYESLVRQLEDAKTLSSDPTPLLNEAFKERLAQAIEQMPFGDTATSFAVFVRNFK